MTKDQLQSLINDRYEEILECSFGQWIRSLWAWFPDLSYEDQKEAFLLLLQRLMQENKVFLFMPRDVPEVVRSEGPYWDIWDIPINEMIDHIRKVWPADVKDEDDEDLLVFWYEGDCPNIGWIDPETRAIVAS